MGYSQEVNSRVHKYVTTGISDLAIYHTKSITLVSEHMTLFQRKFIYKHLQYKDHIVLHDISM